MTAFRLAKPAALVASAVVFFTSPAFGAEGHSGEHGDGGHGHAQSEAHAFGRAVPTDTEADREIVVVAKDVMAFSPASIAVGPGETVRFVVKNTGNLQHSFVLETPAGQRAHEREMQGMAQEKIARHMADEPNGMVVPPGETRTLTWSFTGDELIEFACHLPGHYAAGMKGRLRVRAP